MKETAYSWWRHLAPRERRFISWGGAVLIAALGYAYLWQPVNTERIKLRTFQPQMRANATEMASQAIEATRLRQNIHSILGGSDLKNTIEQASIEAGIDENSLQITMLDEHRVNLTISSTSFDNWIALIARLQSQKRVRIQSASIEALTATGMVQVQTVMATN